MAMENSNNTNNNDNPITTDSNSKLLRGDTVTRTDEDDQKNKLHLDQVGLYGRGAEVSKLRDCLEKCVTRIKSKTISCFEEGRTPDILDPTGRMQTEEQHGGDVVVRENNTTTDVPLRQVVFISGVSGSGKTSTAKEAFGNYFNNKDIKCDKNDKNHVLVVEGKYEMNQDEPYVGIRMACGQICSYILEQVYQHKRSNTKSQVVGNTHQLINLCIDIRQNMGNDLLRILMQFVPILRQLLGRSNKNKNNMLLEASEEGMESFNNGHDSRQPLRGKTTNDKRRINRRMDRKSTSTKNATTTSTTTTTTADIKNQFQFAFLKFLQIVSKYIAPIVMILDDLQWACSSTLELLDVLVSDERADGILVAGIYRSNEVPPTHLLYKYIHETIQRKHDDCELELTQIKIGNLGIDAVQEMITDLLGTTESKEASSTNYHEEIHSLAQLCFKKTQGNSFFLLNYLALLYQLQLLQYDPTTMWWTWDEAEIQTKTLSTDTVVDLLRLQMMELDDGLVYVLQLAACLGASFDIDVLTLIWEDDMEKQSNGLMVVVNHNPEVAMVKQNCLQNRLEQLEASGYVIHMPFPDHGMYRWSHDSIQEAALSLIPENQRQAFCTRIGIILAAFEENGSIIADSQSQMSTTRTESSQMVSCQDNDMVFVIANLLNRGKEPTKLQDKISLARWNRDACLKSMSFSAFDTALIYATRGIACLPEDPWTLHSELAMDLYSNGARAHGSVGNMRAMERCCKEVIEHSPLPLEQKLDVYHVWIDGLTNQGKVAQARDLALDVLNKFNCRMSENSIVVTCLIVANFVRILCTMKSRQPNAIVEMTDPTRIQLIRILDQLITASYFTEKIELSLLCAFRQLNWTMKYGYCEFSPGAFASTGIALTGVLNNLRGGSIYTKHAINLLHRTKGLTESRTLLIGGMCFSWTQPIHTNVKMMLKGYDKGLRIGDTESACWCIYYYVIIRFMLGTPVEMLLADLANYGNQMKNLKRVLAYSHFSLMRQTFMNLAGKDNASNPTNLHGQILCEEKLKEYASDIFRRDGVYLWNGVLKAYYGHFVELADLTLEAGHDYLIKTRPGTPSIMWDSYFKGVSCCYAARTAEKYSSRRRRYAKSARIILNKLKSWRDLGNPNINHYIALVDAEWKAFKGAHAAAIQHYEEAIQISVDRGCIHDAAFASERFGEFQLEVMQDKDGGMYHIEQSIKFWRAWGAHGKASRLEQKHKYVSI